MTRASSARLPPGYVRRCSLSRASAALGLPDVSDERAESIKLTSLGAATTTRLGGLAETAADAALGSAASTRGGTTRIEEPLPDAVGGRSARTADEPLLG